MAQERRFLVIDDDPDGLSLLVRTLRRKFTAGLVQPVTDAAAALRFAKNEAWHAIIAHRTAEIDGASLVRALRAANPQVPIIMVSGADRTTTAKEAGASAF